MPPYRNQPAGNITGHGRARRHRPAARGTRTPWRTRTTLMRAGTRNPSHTHGMLRTYGTQSLVREAYGVRFVRYYLVDHPPASTAAAWILRNRPAQRKNHCSPVDLLLHDNTSSGKMFFIHGRIDTVPWIYFYTITLVRLVHSRKNRYSPVDLLLHDNTSKAGSFTEE
jgi:hypothetical protein